MTGYPILPSTLSDRISVLEAEVLRLETAQSAAEPINSGSYPGGMYGRVSLGNGAEDLNYVDWVHISGSTVSLSLWWIKYIAYLNNDSLDWQIFYYQEVPRLYTDESVAAGTNFVSLGSGTVPILVSEVATDLTISAAIPESIVGTYGQLGVGFDDTNGTTFFQPYTGLIFSN